MKNSHLLPVVPALGALLALATPAHAIQTGPSIGTAYCNANPNSTGQPSELAAFGSRHVADNDLTLECTQLPNDAFGYFILSLQAGFVAQPGGSFGNLCLVGNVSRDLASIQSTATTGTAARTYDLAALPGPMSSFAAAPGDGLHFQFWHRDVGPGGSPVSNFSPGVRVRLACDDVEFGDPSFGGRPIACLDHGDVNGDGHRDMVVVTTDDLLRIYLGDGEGSFAAPLDTSLFGSVLELALMDADGDGHLDFFATTAASVQVFRGDGSGGFTQAGAIATPPNSTGIATADFNGDGILDLAVPAGATGAHVILVDAQGLPASVGNFPATLAGPESLVAGDLDGDGDQDLVLAGFDARSFEVMLQDASGGFASSSVKGLIPNLKVEVADLDLDGTLDLVVGAEGERIRLWEGAGDGTFTLRSTLAQENSFQIGQMTWDGVPDIVHVRRSRQGPETLRGLGGFDFEAVDARAAVSNGEVVALADFTGDGNLDTVQLLPGDEGFQVTPVNSVGWFEGQARELRTYNEIMHLGEGDLDGDGTGDLFWVEQFVTETTLYVSPRRFSRWLPSTGVWTHGLGSERVLASGVQDLDGDGAPELVLSYARQALEVFEVTSTGLSSVGEVGLPANAVGVNFGDVDGDGLPELFASLGGPSGSVSILKRNASGGYYQARRLLLADDVTDAATADFNDDGHVDLAVSTVRNFTQAGGAVVFFGNGTFSFPAPMVIAATGCTSLAAADLTSDGVPELLVGAIGHPTSELVTLQFHGTGQPTELQRVTVPEPANTIRVRDLGRNGPMDVVIAGYGITQVWRGGGTGALVEGRSYEVRGVSNVLLLDHDLDDVEDLVTLSRDRNIYRIRTSWGRCPQ